MGGGVAFFDYNQDGAPDLFFVNGTPWPDHSVNGIESTTHALFENDGEGRFKDVTQAAGITYSDYGMGVAVGDFDNNGWPDLFITSVYQNRLLKNNGDGTFKDVTEASGVGGEASSWSTCASWFDLENDGDLDLFVGNYVQWSPDIDFEQGATLTGIGRAYGQPMNFQGTFPVLYQNDGNGNFTDISDSSGVQMRNPATQGPVAKSLGVAPVDINADGWMDLVVANDTVQNFVFENQKDGSFKEIGSMTGIAFDSYGKARGAMGIDSARFREDNALGIGIANFANEMTALYVGGSSNLIFTDEAVPAGIGPASRLALKFGLFFFDYDLDGWQDMLTTNGHLEEEIHQIQESQEYQQSAHLFWNSGPDHGCRFLKVTSEQSGSDLFKPIVGRGSAFADIDGDGDLDVIMSQVNAAPILLRNENTLDHKWVRLRLMGKSSNRSAIGAWVHARVSGQQIWRQVMPTRSYLSQSELTVTLGLGQAESLESLEIIWPGGNHQEIENLSLNQVHFIEEKP
ncbi:MAG TPA: CRTAC1 family protein [Verrucomicrobiales bacterium]|nr:CRTAC1 family protein [Verrucomicrobiales bacterium]